jgi:hypothetical protein
MYFQKFFIAILLVITIFANYSLAEDKEVPLNLQVKHLFTALNYDNNFKTRTEDTLNIGILYFSDKTNSRREALKLFKALKAYKNKEANNLKMSTSLFSYDSIRSLESILTIEKLDLLYISSGRKSIIRNVTKVTQSKQVFSFTSHPEYVSECGVSMAVGYKENNPKIHLNHSSAKAEGADFNAKFLRIANIVDEKSKR